MATVVAWKIVIMLAVGWAFFKAFSTSMGILHVARRSSRAAHNTHGNTTSTITFLEIAFNFIYCVLDDQTILN